MYQSNRNLLKRMRKCFYDVHKWLDDSFENVFSDLRNVPKLLWKIDCKLMFSALWDKPEPS